jgi:hypothetical protein
MIQRLGATFRIDSHGWIMSCTDILDLLVFGFQSHQQGGSEQACGRDVAQLAIQIPHDLREIIRRPRQMAYGGSKKRGAERSGNTMPRHIHHGHENRTIGERHDVKKVAPDARRWQEHRPRLEARDCRTRARCQRPLNVAGTLHFRGWLGL